MELTCFTCVLTEGIAVNQVNDSKTFQGLQQINLLSGNNLSLRIQSNE